MDLTQSAFAPIPGSLGKPGLYVVTDGTMAKAYIGATRDCGSRFQNHRNDLRHGRHHNAGLQEAYDSGHDLKTIFIATDPSINPFDLEKQIIAEFKPSGVLYNRVQGMGDRKHSPESIEKMRLAKLGKKHTEESKAKLSASGLGKNLGKKRTPEQLATYHLCRLKQAKSVSVGGTEYESVGAVSRVYDINKKTAIQRLRSTTSQFSDWNYN